METKMSEVREFGKHDWDEFAGAESFSKNHEPLIARGTMNDGHVEVTVLADKAGVSIYFYSDDEDEDQLTYHKVMSLNYLRAVGEIQAIVRAIKTYGYAPDLTYEIDHSWNKDDTFYGFKCEIVAL